MARVKLGSVVVVVALMVALTACSSSSKSSSPTSSAGGGVSVTTPAAGSTVKVVVSDTNGLDGKMTMVVDPTSVKAGKITFTLTNTGTIEHEMVVLPLPAGTAYDKLPVETTGPDADKVSEDGSLGEVPELAAGATASVTIDMPAGSYVLVCNIAKHYAMGMEAPFTVT